jgi:hypothetical protein
MERNSFWISEKFDGLRIFKPGKIRNAFEQQQKHVTAASVLKAFYWVFIVGFIR